MRHSEIMKIGNCSVALWRAGHKSSLQFFFEGENVMAQSNRRKFLRNSFAAGCASIAMQGFAGRGALAAEQENNLTAAVGEGSYGELKPMMASNVNETFLALPEGFKYNAFGR